MVKKNPAKKKNPSFFHLFVSKKIYGKDSVYLTKTFENLFYGKDSVYLFVSTNKCTGPDLVNQQ